MLANVVKLDCSQLTGQLKDISVAKKVWTQILSNRTALIKDYMPDFLQQKNPRQLTNFLQSYAKFVVKAKPADGDLKLSLQSGAILWQGSLIEKWTDDEDQMEMEQNEANSDYSHSFNSEKTRQVDSITYLEPNIDKNGIERKVGLTFAVDSDIVILHVFDEKSRIFQQEGNGLQA